MDEILVPTLFDYSLSDPVHPDQSISYEQAEHLFSFFQNHPLFKWNDVHNNCEARADALCIVLDAWGVPNFKSWVFSGAFLRNHIGGLKQLWNYHVAAMLQVKEESGTGFYVIDPATADHLQPLYRWAERVTDYPHSYHLIKTSDQYIFPGGIITKDNWHKRDKQNRKWVIQGLAGINGVSPVGKAQLCFQKKRIRITSERFNALQKLNPFSAP